MRNTLTFGAPIRIAALALAAALTLTRCAGPPAAKPAAPPSKAVPPTIAHDFLDMEKDLGAGDRHRAIVNTLIEKTRGAVTLRSGYTEEQAVALMAAIDRLLKNEGYRFGRNLLLFQGLDAKTIDCDNYCVLYTAMAERLGIPFIPVYAPNHSFLRFTLADGTTMNWETTQGVVRTNEYYVTTLKIAPAALAQGVYLRSLTRKEFLATEFNSIGAYLLTRGRYAAAIPYFNSAIRDYPQFSSAWHNRGSAYYALKQLPEALSDLTKAVGLDPGRASTHNTLGDIRFDKKEYDAALRDYAASIRLDPTNFAPYHNVGLILKQQGKEDKARTWLEKAKEIRKRYGP